MSVSVGGSGGPDVVQLAMMRKAMSAEQTKSAELLKSMETPPPAPPAAPQAQRTWWL